MNIYADSKSPWGKRVWIQDADFEPMMTNAYRQAGSPFTPGRGVDVDAILLRAFGVTPDFGDIDQSCLGRTCFEIDGRYTVMISRRCTLSAQDGVRLCG